MTHDELGEAIEAEKLYLDSECKITAPLWEFRAKYKRYPHEVVAEAARKYHALLPHLEKLQGWEPIESITKDKDFLAVCADGHVCIARIDYGQAVVINNGDYNFGGYGNDYETKPFNQYSNYERITHWQPLPAPPHTEERG